MSLGNCSNNGRCINLFPVMLSFVNCGKCRRLGNTRNAFSDKSNSRRLMHLARSPVFILVYPEAGTDRTRTRSRHLALVTHKISSSSKGRSSSSTDKLRGQFAANGCKR
ncbi:unnamed protein product [Schistosoma curassoni]|uniref:Secreted protein n=1 Tax=Schistosoma curassoni TaxID=6186 RepID=A0A183JH57_9TREM|nr:unnamed protein product [Schistosoma curassoni]